MHTLDINLLVYAFRTESPDHSAIVGWLEAQLNGPLPLTVFDFVLCSFVRIVTNRRIYRDPAGIDEALLFVERLKSSPTFVPAFPSARHWEIFVGLCTKTRARGNLIPDAYLAAMTIDIGGELITADRGFGRWPGLRWRHPLDV